MDNTVKRDFFSLLICPKCKSEELKIKKDVIICERCGKINNVIDGIPIMVTDDTDSVLNLTTDKWDMFYKNSSINIENVEKTLCSQDLKDVLKYIEPLWANKTRCTYMEIGCGPALIGLHMSKKGHTVIGVDTSYEALKLAKNLYKKSEANGFFLCADINNIPIKNETVDIVYGGGVIEHVKYLDMVVSEMFRIMKDSGKAFNTVPYMSLGSLTYRQIWGNIPDFPMLKQAAEFFHIKLLGGKHMKFGYEKSFTMSKLKKVFSKAGFKKNEIDFFDCNLKFDFIKSERAKRFFNKLAKYRLFWPMVYINSLK